MDLITTIYNWGASTMRSLVGNDEPVGLAACTPSLPDRPEQESSAAPAPTPPAPEPAQSAEAAVCEWNQEQAVAYLRANETLLQQIMEEFCIAEPHYYIGTQVNALSQMRGRQGQTINGLIIHGAADDLDLSDTNVLQRISVSFGEGIEVRNIRVENNELVVDLVIARDAATGKRAVAISLQVPTDAGQPQTRELNVLAQENGFEVRRRGGTPPPPPPPPPTTGNPFEL